MSLVEFKNVYKSYGEKEVLKDVSFTIKKNRIVGLLGKNGMGKSTIIKLINGLLTTTKGEVLINGKKPGIESKKIISYLPERTYLDKTQKIKTVLKYFCDFYDNFNLSRAKKLLIDLDLDEESYINKMSKGMIEKLHLVLVMSRDCDLYVLDEPLGGVDPATRDYILDTILSNFKDGASILISTHIIQDIERVLDDVIFINSGKIVLTDTADNIRDKEGESIDEVFRRLFKC